MLGTVHEKADYRIYLLLVSKSDVFFSNFYDDGAFKLSNLSVIYTLNTLSTIAFIYAVKKYKTMSF